MSSSVSLAAATDIPNARHVLLQQTTNLSHNALGGTQHVYPTMQCGVRWRPTSASAAGGEKSVHSYSLLRLAAVAKGGRREDVSEQANVRSEGRKLLLLLLPASSLLPPSPASLGPLALPRRTPNSRISKCKLAGDITNEIAMSIIRCWLCAIH